jgi:hypothetical protein
MANESFLNGAEVVDKITEAFYSHLAAVKENVGAINQLGASYGKLPSDYLKTIKQITDAQNKQVKSEKDLAAATIATQKARQSEITTMIKENALLRDQLRTQQAQEKQTRATGGAYQELSRELNATRANAKNLAADMYMLEAAGERNSATYNQLQAEFSETQASVLRLDAALKDIDASVGQHQRKVGQYENAYNGLGNSINQLTRELPAFAINANTGFLAISNNLPMLFDELQRINAANRVLIAQGKEVVPAITQVAKAFFSWGTALSLGVTALTLYGGKLVEFISNLSKSKAALDAVATSQKILSDARLKAQKGIVDEITTIKLYLQTARDENELMVEREIAVKKLQDQYAYYFGQLSKGEILAGKTAEAEERLNKALEAKENLDAISVSYNKNQENLVTINSELIKQNQIIRKEEKTQAALRKAGREETMSAITVANQLLESQNRQNKAIGIINTLTNSQNYYQSINNKLINEAIASKKIAIGLEYEEEKINKKDVQREDLVDFEASAYALQKARLENELAYNKEIVDNEKNGYADREAASVRYGEILLELNQNLRDEELRLLKRNSELEIAELKRRASEGEITQLNAAAVIKSIEKQAAYDRELIYENYSKGVIDANAEIQSSLEGVWKALNEQEQTMRRLDFMTNNMRQLGNIFENVDANTTIAQFDKIKKRVEEINQSEQDDQINNLRLQRQSIDTEIAKIQQQEKTVENNKEINRLLIEQKQIDNQIVDIETKRKENNAKMVEDMKRATDSYLKGIQSSVLSGMGFSSLSSIVSGEFDKALDNAQTMGEKFAVVFNTVGNIAKDTFAFITQNSQAQFDAEYALLERRKEAALKFAGENRAAQEEINRQYDERQREIRNRELKAQKEQAIFNAIINTAQGVTQIAFIASQQVPAYADGGVTDTDGNILVNDAKGSNYKEVVVTPSGKTIKPSGRNRIMNVPKGTRIFKNYQEHENALNNMLANSGIAPASEMLNRTGLVSQASNGISKADLREVMRQTLGSMPVTNHKTVFNEHGFTNYVEKGHSSMEWRNNHLSLQGRTFGRG